MLAGQERKFAVNLLGALGRPDLVELCALPPGPGQNPVRDYLSGIFKEKKKSIYKTIIYLLLAIQILRFTINIYIRMIYFIYILISYFSYLILFIEFTVFIYE